MRSPQDDDEVGAKSSVEGTRYLRVLVPYVQGIKYPGTLYNRLKINI